MLCGEICRSDTERGKPSISALFSGKKQGLLEQIFHYLGADADLQDIITDSTYIKTYKASAGIAKRGIAMPKTNDKANALE